MDGEGDSAVLGLQSELYEEDLDEFDDDDDVDG